MSTTTDTPETNWVPTHKKLKNGETVYTGDQGEWDMDAESPPGPEKKERSAREEDGSKFAATNDAILNYNNNITNKNLQLDDIMNIEDFEALELTPPKWLDQCDTCLGEMAEPAEIERVRAEHPDWRPGPSCHCYDEEDGPGVQVCLAAVREVWAKNPKWFKPANDTDDVRHEYKRIDAIDFPKSIHQDAFHGVAGEVVSML